MKKVIKAVVSILTLVFVSFTLISFSKPKSAEDYYEMALHIIDEKGLINMPPQSLEKTTSLLESCIELNKNNWKPYWQLIQLYRCGSNKDYDKVSNIFDEYIKNGNELNNNKKMSFACTLYTLGKKDDAYQLFDEIYNNFLSSDKANFEEEDFVACLFSGIVTGKIDKKGLEKITEENKKKELNLIFQSFFTTDKDEIIECYAGV